MYLSLNRDSRPPLSLTHFQHGIQIWPFAPGCEMKLTLNIAKIAQASEQQQVYLVFCSEAQPNLAYQKQRYEE